MKRRDFLLALGAATLATVCSENATADEVIVYKSPT